MHFPALIKSILATLLVAALAAGCGSTPAPSDRRAAGRERPASSPRLFLAGDGELWVVDVATETVRHLNVPELAGGDPPYRILRRDDRLVVWGKATYLIDADREHHLRPLVRGSLFFIPGARQDRVWIAFRDPRSPATVGGLRAVREMTVDGRVTVADTRPPGGRWPAAATAAGLLFWKGESRLEVWDPVTRTVVRSFDAAAIGDLGPTRGNLLSSCADRCRTLRLTDVRTGHRRMIPAPHGFAFEPWTGQFSPDGDRLGIAVRPFGRSLKQESSRRLVLIDVRGGSTTLVAGTQVPGGYAFVAWASAGDYVFLTGGARFEERAIVAYRLGESRARRLRVTVGPFYGVAAL